MMFQKKVNRAMDYAHEQAEKRDPHKEQRPEKIDKSDLPSMILSAYLVLVPVALLAIAAICLVGYFFVVR